MSKYPIFVFEGIEGTGKSTQVKSISVYLKKKRVPFIILREPGGSKNSEKIRKILLNKKSNFNPITDLLLYLASRSENIEKIINKNLNKKIILIENADPGFDWIFSHSIKGLITKYGGAASHMAIRCAEFGLPAAIGCGNAIFEKLLNAKKVRLDSLNKKITVLQ